MEGGNTWMGIMIDGDDHREMNGERWGGGVRVTVNFGAWGWG